MFAMWYVFGVFNFNLLRVVLFVWLHVSMTCYTFSDDTFSLGILLDCTLCSCILVGSTVEREKKCCKWAQATKTSNRRPHHARISTSHRIFFSYFLHAAVYSKNKYSSFGHFECDWKGFCVTQRSCWLIAEAIKKTAMNTRWGSSIAHTLWLSGPLTCITTYRLLHVYMYFFK